MLASSSIHNQIGNKVVVGLRSYTLPNPIPAYSSLMANCDITVYDVDYRATFFIFIVWFIV
jgi:hypothetical protein